MSWVAHGDYIKGLEDFVAAEGKSPKQDLKYKILLNMGINLRRVGNLDKSIQKLSDAINTAQVGKAQAYNNLGLSYFEDSQEKEALQQF